MNAALTFRPSPLTDCPLACLGRCGDATHAQLPCPGRGCEEGRIAYASESERDAVVYEECRACDGAGTVHVDHYLLSTERVPCCLCRDASCQLCDRDGLMAVEVALHIAREGVRS